MSNAASKVVISNGASAIAMASLTISAGTVVLSPEAELSMTGPIRVNGTGTLIANHRILFSGRATDWTWAATNGSQTVTFAENVQANSDVAAGDFIAIGDDDPESLIARITHPIKVGPGVAAPNEYRSSHAKWKRFRVTGAATGGVVPLEYDQLTGSLADSYTAGAYTGSHSAIFLACIAGWTFTMCTATFSANMVTRNLPHGR